jgi:hypothetical protein
VAAARLLTNLVNPTAIDMAPEGTKMNAVHQTARPTPIASTPPASHGQATFTEEAYCRLAESTGMAA